MPLTVPLELRMIAAGPALFPSGGVLSKALVAVPPLRWSAASGAGGSAGDGGPKESRALTQRWSAVCAVDPAGAQQARRIRPLA